MYDLLLGCVYWLRELFFWAQIKTILAQEQSIISLQRCWTTHGILVVFLQCTSYASTLYISCTSLIWSKEVKFRQKKILSWMLLSSKQQTEVFLKCPWEVYENINNILCLNNKITSEVVDNLNWNCKYLYSSVCKFLLS